MVTGQVHAYRKYTERAFKADEPALGWHAKRFGQARGSFSFPAPDRPHRLPPLDGRSLDRSSPRTRRHWQWRRPGEMSPRRPRVAA